MITVGFMGGAGRSILLMVEGLVWSSYAEFNTQVGVEKMEMCDAEEVGKECNNYNTSTLS